jgi:predicted DNA-binding antitoxin AbrB/MazE fold protein
MYIIKGRIENGVILPDEPLEHRDGEAVLITLMGIDEEQALASIDDVIARLTAAGPSEGIEIPPKDSLFEKLSVVPHEEPIDSAEWNRQWAQIEAEMKARDLADDRAEGR